MTSAVNIDDARARAARILEAFERRVVANKRAAEEVILKSFYFDIKLFSGNQLVCCLTSTIYMLIGFLLDMIIKQIEHASLKEHLRSLLDNNQILRRVVAIQHERNVEQEGKEREVQHVKLMLNQYIEQARTLEVCFFSTSASIKCQHTVFVMILVSS